MKIYDKSLKYIPFGTLGVILLACSSSSLQMVVVSERQWLTISFLCIGAFSFLFLALGFFGLYHLTSRKWCLFTAFLHLLFPFWVFSISFYFGNLPTSFLWYWVTPLVLLQVSVGISFLVTSRSSIFSTSTLLICVGVLLIFLCNLKVQIALMIEHQNSLNKLLLSFRNLSGINFIYDVKYLWLAFFFSWLLSLSLQFLSFKKIAAGLSSGVAAREH